MTETDPELRVRQTDIGPVASARRMNAAVPIRSNLLRLEHELQTVVDGSACAAGITLSAHGIGDTASAAHMPPARAPLGLLRLPCSFKGIGLASSSVSVGALLRRNGSKAASASTPAIGSHRGGRAECPDGTQPEHFDRQPYLLKAAGTELASRLQHLPGGAPFSCRRAQLGDPLM